MYKGHKVIDIHSHMSTPPEFSLFSVGLLMVRRPTKSRQLEMSDDSLESALKGHMKAMDDRDIDFQLISPRPNHMFHWEVDYVQELWCRTTNDVIHRTCKLHPDRFAGIGQLPQNSKKDTRNCLEELERCVKELGFIGAIVNSDPGADGDIPGMHDEYWFPLYEKAQELDIPLVIHPAHSRDPRVKAIPNSYQLMVAFGEFLSTASLEHSNVFELFPRLKIVVSHFGGALNRFLMTDENHVYGNKDLKDHIFFDTCAYEPNYIRAALKQKGVHRCLFGTETPGAGSWAWNYETNRPQDDLIPVFDSIEFLSEDDKIDIFNRNVLRVFAKLNLD